MTYGYRPDTAFRGELERRGIDVADIERVELRPAAEATTDVVVTLRSGRVESWRQPQEAEQRPSW